MTQIPDGNVLAGRRALVMGVANAHSVAYGCARVFRRHGAEVALTYLNEKTRSQVEPLARELGTALFMPCAAHLTGMTVYVDGGLSIMA